MLRSRQLAAIMFTDIVGYTALMGEDEQGAFDLLKKNRDIQRPIIERFNGRWLKEIGDGVLASFSTVSDAVYCAKEIQETCLTEPDLKLRIGIHLGEVVFETNDVFGDGVNIASRLEHLAPAGGILVSEVVHKNLINKKDIQSTFVGEEQLKNVKESVRMYQIHLKGMEPIAEFSSSDVSQKESPKPKYARRITLVIAGIIAILLSYVIYTSFTGENDRSEILPASNWKSIAVLPFTNLSSDPEQNYFVIGMTNEIRHQLNKIQDLDVIPGTSAIKYVDNQPSTTQIGKDLDVAYLIAGNVRKSGQQVRMLVELIDVVANSTLWSKDYEGTPSVDSLINFQTIIAKQVAAELSATITPVELRQIDQSPTSNSTAYDYYLQGNAQIETNLPDNNLVAMSYFKRAIDEDSTFSRAYAGLARTMAHQHLRFGQEYSWLADSALQMLNKALVYDPDNNVFLTMKCFMLIQLGRYDETKKVQESLQQVVGVESGQYINVKFIEHQFKGNIDSMMYWSLKWQEITELEYDPIWTIPVTYMWLGEFSKSMTLSKDLASGFEMLQVPILQALKEQDLAMAKRHSEAMIPVHPYWGFLKTGEIAIRMGDYSDAISKLEEALERHPTLPFPGYFNRSINTVLSYAYLQTGENSKARDLLQEVRKSNLHQVEIGEQNMKYRYDLASGYSVEGKAELASYWLEEARKQGLNQYWLLEDDPIFDKISDHVRYQQVIAEMKSYIERMRIRVRELKEQMSIDH